MYLCFDLVGWAAEYYQYITEWLRVDEKRRKSVFRAARALKLNVGLFQLFMYKARPPPPSAILIAQIYL